MMKNKVVQEDGRGRKVLTNGDTHGVVFKVVTAQL
jgi:hypothetical protein